PPQHRPPDESAGLRNPGPALGDSRALQRLAGTAAGDGPPADRGHERAGSDRPHPIDPRTAVDRQPASADPWRRPQAAGEGTPGPDRPVEGGPASALPGPAQTARPQGEAPTD